MCTRHYHSPCPLSIHRHHRRPNPYPPSSGPCYPLSHSTRWKFSGIIRDLRRGKRAPPLLHPRRPPAPSHPFSTRRYLPRFVREKDEQRYLSLPFLSPDNHPPPGILVYLPSTLPPLCLGASTRIILVAIIRGLTEQTKRVYSPLWPRSCARVPCPPPFARGIIARRYVIITQRFTRYRRFAARARDAIRKIARNRFAANS